MDKRSFAEFLAEVEMYLSVLAPGLFARPLLVAFRDQAIVTSDVEAQKVTHGNPIDWNLSEALYCTKSAEVAQESRSKQC